MNAMLAPTLGLQRESDAQRRVDQAVRFAVWACTLQTFPRPPEIQREFGVSRSTAGRWRKSLALAMRDMTPPPPTKPLPTQKRRPTAVIVQALLADPALLDLAPALLARDVRERFGSAPRTAKRAVNDALKHAAVGSAPHGTSA